MTWARLIAYITIFVFVAASQIPPPSQLNREYETTVKNVSETRASLPSFTWWEIKPHLKIILVHLNRICVPAPALEEHSRWFRQSIASPTAIHLLSVQRARGPPVEARA